MLQVVWCTCCRSSGANAAGRLVHMLQVYLLHLLQGCLVHHMLQVSLLHILPVRLLHMLLLLLFLIVSVRARPLP